MELTTLADIENPTVGEKVKYPGEWFGDSKDISVEKEEIRDEVEGVENVILSDTDTDGLSCIAILTEAMDDVGVVANGHSGGLEMSDVLSEINTADNINLYVCDLLPDDSDFEDVVEELLKVEGDVEIYDHHQWDDSQIEIMEEVCDYNDIRPDEEVCTTNIVYERFEDEVENENIDEDFVEVVRDHDVWVKEDERSDDLSDLLQNTEQDYFIESVKDNGADVMQDTEIREIVESARLEQKRKIEYQIKNFTTWFEVFKLEDGLAISIEGKDDSIDRESADDSFVLAVSYGSAYRSKVGNILCEGWGENYEEEFEEDTDSDFSPGDADIAAVVLPYNKVSFRSSEDFPYCAKIAGRLNGGGHEEAAGCKPGFVGDAVSYKDHIEEEGETVKRIVVDKIVDMVSDGNLL
jgi:oligoribonuclease NrnB/cAMP/cGMP phosphodiesterase (DHH superfamily)